MHLVHGRGEKRPRSAAGLFGHRGESAAARARQWSGRSIRIPGRCCSRTARAAAARGSARSSRRCRNGSPPGPETADRRAACRCAEIFRRVKDQFDRCRRAGRSPESSGSVGAAVAIGGRGSARASRRSCVMRNSSMRMPDAGWPRRQVEDVRGESRPCYLRKVRPRQPIGRTRIGEDAERHRPVPRRCPRFDSWPRDAPRRSTGFPPACLFPVW